MTPSCARWAAIAVFVAACGGGGNDDEAIDAGPMTCTLSPECGVGRWCNPATSMCEQRSSVVNFDRDLFPTIEAVCLACHLPGGVGVRDVNGTGVPLLYTGGPATVYANLTAGGTTCSGPGKGRVCVNEPQWSLGVIRVTPQDGDGGVSFFVFPDGLHDAWVQNFMRWAAAGARREPIPDGGGLPDARIVDAAAAPPDARIVDAPVITPPDARTFDAPPPPPDAPPPRPDASILDTVAPTGGDVTAAASDACGQVTLTIAAGSDDETPSNMLRYEVCWGSAPASCSGVGWVTRATFSAPGTQVADVASRSGTTQHFMGRVVDLSDNRSTPAQTRAAVIPTFLSWSAGNPTVTKTAQPGTYAVSWPTVSSSCPTKAPLDVSATCSGALTSCSCTLAGNQQSATCTATTCDAITVSVEASAGNASIARQGAYTMRFDAVDTMLDNYPCRGCHQGFGPTFTTADVGTLSGRCPDKAYIAAGSPGDSMIYGVATTKTFLCGGAHLDFGTMTAEDQSTLRCWIQGGALP